MTVLFDFHRYLEVSESNTNVSSFVFGVLSFRLGISTVWKALSKIGEQCVSAGVLRFRLNGSSVRVLVPVLFPVVGIAIPYRGSQLAQPVHH